MRAEAEKAVALAVRALTEPELPDFVCLVDGIEFGIVLDEYNYTPPSGRCAQRCETPDEYYGHITLEYRIVSIWTDTDHDPHYDMLGDDLSVPPDVNDGDLYYKVLDWARNDNF
jgi:hypothetical protein